MLNPKLLALITVIPVSAVIIPFAFWLRGTPAKLRKVTYILAALAFCLSAVVLFGADERLFSPVLVMIVIVGLLNNTTSEKIKHETAELRAKIENIEKRLSEKV